MTDSKGIAPYSGRKPGKPGPRDVLALLQEKCRLRALMEEQQAKIDLALPHLDPAQTQELLSLMSEESSDSPDVVRVQEEVVQAAQGIQPMDVRRTRVIPT